MKLVNHQRNMSCIATLQSRNHSSKDSSRNSIEESMPYCVNLSEISQAWNQLIIRGVNGLLSWKNLVHQVLINSNNHAHIDKLLYTLSYFCISKREDTLFDGVPVRVYRPTKSKTSSPRAGMVFYHGGGWILGSVGEWELY